VLPAFGRPRQKECKFEASLGYIVRLCLNQPKTEGRKKGKEEKSLLGRQVSVGRKSVLLKASTQEDGECYHPQSSILGTSGAQRDFTGRERR
jgi:hypothetical protein